METLLEGMAEYYIANLGKEVKKGHKENALICKHNGGIPLLGYDIDKNLNYIINEDEAKIVRIIFDMYSKGYTVRKIITTLNEKGYKTKRGNAFGKNSISDLIRNEKYTGVYTFGYGDRQKNRNKPKEDMIKIDGGMPAIISKEVFNMVQNRIKRKNGGSGKASHVYLLTGILFCGKCGESYIGQSSNGRCKYGCKKRINKVSCDNLYLSKDKIEDYVINNLYNLIDNNITDEFVEKVNKEYFNSKEELKDSLSLTKSNLSNIEKQIQNLVSAVASGIINDSIKNELTKLENEKTDLENKLNFLNSVKEIKEISKDDILKVIRNDINVIKTLSEEEQKVILHKYIKKILVYPDKIEITFNINNNQILATKKAMSCNTHSDGGQRWIRTIVLK